MAYSPKMVALERGAFAIICGMITAAALIATPSEATGQVKLTDMELAGTEVTPYGDGLRLFIKTHGDATTIPDENIIIRSRHTLIRLHVLWLEVDKDWSTRTQIDTSGVEGANNSFIFRNGIHTMVRMRFNMPGSEAIEGYRLTRTPEGLEFIFPLGSTLSPEEPIARNVTQSLTMLAEKLAHEAYTAPEIVEPAPSTVQPTQANTAVIVAPTPVAVAPTPVAVAPTPTTAEVTPTTAVPTPNAATAAPATREAASPVAPSASLQPTAAPVIPVAATPPGPAITDKTVELVGVVCISLLVALALFLGFRSLQFQQQRRPSQAPQTDNMAPTLSAQAQILASYPIDATTRILFLDLLGEAMAFSQNQDGSMQLLYRLGPDASSVLYREVGVEPSPKPEAPKAKAKLSTSALDKLIPNANIEPMTPNPDAPDSGQHAQRLMFKAPVFETSATAADSNVSSSADSNSGDFGHTLASLSQEIHLKALEEGRSKESMSIAHGLPSGLARQSNSAAWWMNRVEEQGDDSFQDSDLFRALVHGRSPENDLSEVQDSSMIDISFVVGEDDADAKLKAPSTTTA